MVVGYENEKSADGSCHGVGDPDGSGSGDRFGGGGRGCYSTAASVFFRNNEVNIMEERRW